MPQPTDPKEQSSKSQYALKTFQENINRLLSEFLESAKKDFGFDSLNPNDQKTYNSCLTASDYTPIEINSYWFKGKAEQAQYIMNFVVGCKVLIEDYFGSDESKKALEIENKFMDYHNNIKTKITSIENIKPADLNPIAIGVTHNEILSLQSLEKVRETEGELRKQTESIKNQQTQIQLLQEAKIFSDQQVVENVDSSIATLKNILSSLLKDKFSSVRNQYSQVATITEKFISLVDEEIKNLKKAIEHFIIKIEELPTAKKHLSEQIKTSVDENNLSILSKKIADQTQELEKIKSVLQTQRNNITGKLETARIQKEMQQLEEKKRQREQEEKEAQELREKLQKQEEELRKENEKIKKELEPISPKAVLTVFTGAPGQDFPVRVDNYGWGVGAVIEQAQVDPNFQTLIQAVAKIIQEEYIDKRNAEKNRVSNFFRNADLTTKKTVIADDLHRALTELNNAKAPKNLEALKKLIAEKITANKTAETDAKKKYIFTSSILNNVLKKIEGALQETDPLKKLQESPVQVHEPCGYKLF